MPTATVPAKLAPYATREILDEARAWLADCAWRDLEPEDVYGLTDVSILLGVDHHYVGGIAQFATDADLTWSM